MSAVPIFSQAPLRFAVLTSVLTLLQSVGFEGVAGTERSDSNFDQYPGGITLKTELPLSRVAKEKVENRLEAELM